MKVYKKVRLLKDGNCYPLFIDKTNKFVFGEWQKAEFHSTKGFAERSLGYDDDGNKLGGWHCCYIPLAPHLSDTLSNGEKRIWIECEAKGKHSDYARPESQGGTWCLYEYIKPLRILTEDEVNCLIA